MNKLEVDVYKVLNDCVENGTERGWRRAHKHDGAPDVSYIKEQIIQNIMLEICEYFKFDEDEKI